MDPAAAGKPSQARRLVARALLLGVVFLLLRLVFVVAVHGISGGGGYYSAAFRRLAAGGYISPASRSLCVAASGLDVAALHDAGVADAVGISESGAPPLVVTGDLLRQPFAGEEFDFVFAGIAALDGSTHPLDLASEIARVLKPEGFLAVHTSSAGDPYSLQSLLDLFPGFQLLKSQEIAGIASNSILREIVLQKEAIPTPNSGNECKVSEHMLKIVHSAEPLIKEEPLKPWITLKKNLKNTKYLSSIADISFKTKYVYVDVGARSYGSSIGSWFRKQYPKQNRTFEIYAIEADKAFHHEYAAAAKKGVNLLPFAAWVRNETLSFEINWETEHRDDQEGPGMGRIRPVGAHSNRASSEVRTVRGFDFAEWLKRTVSETDYVVVKMDVEGTEFDLVPRLFQTEAICLIDELFLECHYNRWQKCCPGVRSPKYQNTYEECIELFTSLRESGVFVHQWW